MTASVRALIKLSNNYNSVISRSGYVILVRNVSTKEHLKSIASNPTTFGNINNLKNDEEIKKDNLKKALDTKFENTQIAFKSKSTLELLRGLLVFQLCSVEPLVNNQNFIMKWSRQLLGKSLFSLLMKSTFYGHFVAGEDQNAVKITAQNLANYGVKSILDYSVEDDINSTVSHHGSDSLHTHHYHPMEPKFDKNMEIFIECIDTVANATNATGMAAIKITSLIRPKLLAKFSDFILEMKNPSVLDWKNLINLTSESQFGSEKIKFTSNEIGEISNMIKRIDAIMKHAINKDVRVFVDAEQTYFQVAIRHLTMQSMKEFNKDKMVVFNTYQNYLKSANKELLEDLQFSSKENFKFGAKLVRGAYMEQERPRAKEMGYEDPINPSYEATTEMYEKNLIVCLNEIKKRKPNDISIMVASHNEDTVRFSIEKMKEHGINPNDDAISFGQLLGMCDYISFSLSAAGYPVYKYTPYGPVEEVLPYLSRRAVENRGIFDKVKKEKKLLFSEIKRRLSLP